jgi:hypothetical protein
MTLKVVRSDVPCAECKSMLCNFCLSNGYCQDCATAIPEETADLALDYFDTLPESAWV